MSLGYSQNGTFFYFGEPLTRYHIALRRGRRFLDSFRLMGALVFGFGFLGIFGWWVNRYDYWSDIFTAVFWFEITAPVKAVFWLGIICLSYLWYRLILLGEPKAEIAYGRGSWKQAEAGAEESLDAAAPLAWRETVRLPRSRRVNIAAVFTESTRMALEDAWQFAVSTNQPAVRPEHIFYALLSSETVAGVFIRLGVSTKRIQAKMKRLFSPGQAPAEPVIAVETGEILFHAYRLAVQSRDRHVRETELLVSAVMSSEAVQEILYELEIDNQKLSNVIAWVRVRERLRDEYRSFRKAAARRSKYGMDRAMTAIATPYLNSFSEDITLAAKLGYLSPCLARDQEINEIFRIIEGGRQSVILVGERGVGKRSIIEGVAQRMVEESVPDRLRDKRLVQLSTSALMAGTTVSGAQERVLRIMREIGRAGNIILFINNLHDLMGLEGGEQGLDIADTLSEYLGPSRFMTLATSVPEGYNRHIVASEIGKMLAKVEVREMNEDQAVQVLESKAGTLEYKHQVFFSYAAIEACVNLAARFLHDQNLPSSALSVMAEAAPYVHNTKGANHLVTSDDVAAIIAQKTGIPVTSLTEDESEKLLRLETEMHERVIGQHEAVALVANALRRARAEIRSTNRPIANFLFLGPTGVGKTELAKTIAGVYFSGEDRMVRLDMSEYQDKSSVYRIIGQPGQQGTGLLTEAVRQQPFSLVLLDELEKADPDILNLFLQVFDDGRLTDSVGRVIDFTNTIIIATSNAGTAYVQDELRSGRNLSDIREELVRGKLREYYRPEFLNRFDGIVLFKPLERAEIKQIAGLMLKRVAKDLEVRGVELRVEDIALDALADVGFDPDFGARPMRRAIQEHVENKLAELVLSGRLKRRDVIVLGEGMNLRVESASAALAKS